MTDELHQASGFLCAGHLGKLLPTECSQCVIEDLRSQVADLEETLRQMEEGAAREEERGDG